MAKEKTKLEVTVEPLSIEEAADKVLRKLVDVTSAMNRDDYGGVISELIRRLEAAYTLNCQRIEEDGV